jgi:hypothetical protein
MAAKKDAKGKGKGKGKADAAAAPPGKGIVHLAAHPRAKRHIAAAKAWGGLIGFGLTLMLGLQGPLSTPEAVLRALIAGIVFYVLAWAGAVAVWSQLAVGEVHAERRALLEAAEAAQAERSAQTHAQPQV